MNLREAILKAADHIENNPAQFNYGCISVPECGTQACAAGWICFFLDVPAGQNAAGLELADTALGIPYDEFDHRMDIMSAIDGDNGRWMRDASACAKALRRYADDYCAA